MPGPVGVMVCMVLGLELLERVSQFYRLISRIYNKPSDIEGSAKAVSSVALLFHSVSLITLAVVSMVWQRKDKGDTGNIQLDSDSENGESDDQDDSELTRTRDTLMRRVWKPSLAALAASLVGVCLLASIAKQFSFAATMVSLLLGGNGMLFALSNWVPYSLISHEASAQARARVIITEEGDTVDDEDDTPTLLAVHNMAITVPQMVASVTSWLLMQSLAVLGMKQDVVWIFALSIPSALWAACL
ncbi:hypothetical protein PT974_02046 [Cladobotryum mycophilum]|uniref:Solute carrier family 40 protein n=1 Tax=Cladobotryum mycophilum TaxID=491253 RepID=A0ABR0SY84_9HYPO